MSNNDKRNAGQHPESQPPTSPAYDQPYPPALPGPYQQAPSSYQNVRVSASAGQALSAGCFGTIGQFLAKLMILLVVLIGVPTVMIVGCCGGLATLGTVGSTDSEQAKVQVDLTNATPEELKARLESLERKNANTEGQRAIVRQIVLVGARTYWDDVGLPKPYLTFTLRNGSEQLVTRAGCHFAVLTPGRTLPWMAADFNFDIPGGLEPGESREFTFSGNYFIGEWEDIPRDRTDLVVDMKLTRLEGLNKRIVYDESEIPDYDKDIEALRAKLAPYEATLKAEQERAEAEIAKRDAESAAKLLAEANAVREARLAREQEATAKEEAKRLAAVKLEAKQQAELRAQHEAELAARPTSALYARRLWASGTGTYRVMARLVEVDGDDVVLRKDDGKNVTVNWEKLSNADLIYLRDVKQGKILKGSTY